MKIKYRHAFLLPFFAMIFGCITKGIFPFGGNSFLRSDLYNQYIQFIQQFCHTIRSGESLAYSFEIGMGSGISALYAYYVASPTNWLLVIVPDFMLIEALTIMVLIKVGLSGLTFFYYLRKHYDQTDLGTLLCSSAYALSGFMAAYQWNVMWLDVVILAPLVIWALEVLVKEGKWSNYCILLACSIFTNFYLSIMLCIFLVCYFFTLLVGAPKKIRAMFLFAWSNILAGAMTAGLLIPVYVSLSGTEFHAWNFPEQLKWYMNPLELFMRHCIDVNMKVQYDHWPNIYVGVAFFLILPLFVMNKEITLRSKITKVVLLVIFWLSFSCNMLEMIWHGMNYPDSLPARQGYLYTFVAITIGYEVYSHLQSVKFYEIIVASVIAIALVVAGMIFVDIEGVDMTSFVLTLVFLALYIALMCIYYFIEHKEFLLDWNRDRKLIVGGVLFILITVELCTNLVLTSIRTANRNTFLTHYETMDEAIAWLEEENTDFYRVELFDRLTKNDSMMWDIKTTTLFSSTANANVSNMFHEMGMGHTKVSYWNKGATPLMNALLTVQYKLAEEEEHENSLYKIIYNEDGAYVYENQYPLSVGYCIDSDVVSRWDYTKYAPLSAQNEFCRELGIKGKLYENIEEQYIDDRNYEISVSESGYIYLYIGNNSISEIKVTIGDKIKEFEQVSFDYILDLGYLEEGSEVMVEIIEDEEDEFKVFEAYRMNEEVLKETIALLSKNNLEVIEYTQDSLRGTVTLDEKQDLVIAIPMEKGWEIYVDGEAVIPETFMDALIRIPLEAGVHEIYLEYNIPGFQTALLVSVISIGIWLLCRKRSKLSTTA